MEELMLLSGTGVWAGQLRFGDPGEIADAAAELDDLGYSALWVPDVGGDVFGALRRLLAATQRAVAATGILNIWMHEPQAVAEGRAELVGEYGERVLLGLGVSHAPLIDATSPGRYTKPLEVMRTYLDALDAAVPPVPAEFRVLAALRPRMIELAATRARGAHPYLVLPEHTRGYRALLGDEALLAVEQAVLLETDPAKARQVARVHLATYLGLPNYTGNWLRAGFTADDLEQGGSDRLVDALVAWGDEDTVLARVQEHRDAGADHVCIQALTADPRDWPRDAWRRLAGGLIRG
jgi:probable F420-dependent oxidoreductase